MMQRSDTPVYYVLRNKQTGKLMPSFKGRAGGTYVDPAKSKDPPRLFTTTLAARNALLWWSRGMVRMVGGRSQSFDPFDDGSGYEIAKQEPVTGRNIDEWEVTPAAIFIEVK